MSERRDLPRRGAEGRGKGGLLGALRQPADLEVNSSIAQGKEEKTRRYRANTDPPQPRT